MKQRKKTSQKTSLWTHKMKFCQPLRNILKNRQKIFHSMSEKDKKKTFYSASNRSSGHVRCKFDNLVEKTFYCRPKYFRSSSKTDKRSFFQKKSFCSKCSLGNVEWNLTTDRKKICQKTKFVGTTSENGDFFKMFHFLQNVPLDT